MNGSFSIDVSEIEKRGTGCGASALMTVLNENFSGHVTENVTDEGIG